MPELYKLLSRLIDLLLKHLEFRAISQLKLPATFLDTLGFLFREWPQRRNPDFRRIGRDNMKSEIKFALLSIALAAFTLPGLAQSADASTQGSASGPTPAAQGSTSANGQVTGQTINQRKENQQDRIAQGVKSGELTAGETANLEKKESNLNRKSAICAAWIMGI